MNNVSAQQLKKIKLIANDLRRDVIDMLTRAGSGHTAGPLGMADIFAALYFYVLKHRPRDPNWAGRDRLVLSNGHICPIRYAAMAHAGYFSVKELMTLRQYGSRLQGHPERQRLPGLETTSGPLGSGLGQASGMAYVAKMDKKNFYVYCAMSDAEQQAGNTWESAMFAAKNNLGNLIGIIDRNMIQIGGTTEDIMPVDSLKEKYQSFGWQATVINGHNINQFIQAIGKAKKSTGQPTVIIAQTIAGKGVKSIEGDYQWHGKVPTELEAEEFKMQLDAVRKKIK